MKNHKAICACGKPVSEELQAEIDKEYREGWQEVFDMFHKGKPELGSAGWLVTPFVVRNFIEDLMRKL